MSKKDKQPRKRRKVRAQESSRSATRHGSREERLPGKRQAHEKAGRRKERPKAPCKRWRTWLGRVALAIFAPVIFFGALELGLRIVGYGYPSGFFVEVPGRPEVMTNDRFAYRFFEPIMARSPVPSVMPQPQPDESYRIFVLGGSAARGTPDSAFAVSRILEVLLRAGYPGIRFEVVNAAMTAINSHVVLPIAKDCAEQGGDLFVVYMGNNEVVGPYGPGTVFAPFSGSRAAIRASIALRATRSGQLIAGVLNDIAGGRHEGERWGGMAMFEGNYVTSDDPRLESTYSHFAANLRAIARTARSAGAATLLCTVPVNLGDWAPFASLHDPEIGKAGRNRWDAAYQAGMEAQEAGRTVEAIEKFRAALAIDGRHAGLHYSLACALRAANELEAARKHFVRARNLDVLRFRADSRINSTIREVASSLAPEEAVLVDAEERLESDPRSPGGVPGEAFFYEHVHLTFAGRYIIARCVLDAIEPLLPERVRKQARKGEPVLSEQECRKRLAFTGYERVRMAEKILTMVKEPPFTKRLDHEEDLAERRRELKRLRASLGAKGSLKAHLKAVRTALKRAPKDLHFLRELAESSSRLGDHETAVGVLEKLLERVPGLAPLQLSLARALERAGRPEEAEEAYRRVIALRPRSPDAHRARNDVGMLLVEKGRTEEAIEILRGALTHSWRAWGTHNNLGSALMQAGALKKAEHHFRRAIELRPGYALAHHNLAALLVKSGRLRAALEELRKAARLDPQLPGVKENLRQLEEKLKP